MYSNRKDPFTIGITPNIVSEELSGSFGKKLKNGELQKLDITPTFRDRPISEIEEKIKPNDDNCFEYSYDLSLCATGSRAFVPSEVQINYAWPLTRENESEPPINCVNIYRYRLAMRKQHVVIVGGGLLGLELAACTKE